MSTNRQSDDDHKNQTGSDNEASFDLIGEPRTLPAAWDLSELMSPPHLRRNGSSKRHTTVANIATDSELAPEVSEQSEWRPDPFPEPKTYPALWDFDR